MVCCFVPICVLGVIFCLDHDGRAQTASAQRHSSGQRSSGQAPSQPPALPQPSAPVPPPVAAPGSDVAVFDPGSSIARDYFRGGIVLGRALLRPTLEIGLEGDSNFLTLAETRGARNGIFAISPGLDLEMPVLRSGFRLTYAPVIRLLNIAGLPRSNVSHQANLDIVTKPAPALDLSFRVHAARAVFDTLEFDPGREVFFSAKPFWRMDAALSVSYLLSPRSTLTTLIGVNTVQFRGRPETTDLFFDHTTTRASLRYIRRLSRRHIGELGMEVATNGSLRAANALDPRLNNYRLAQPTVTILSQLTPTLTGQMSLAWRHQRFPHAVRSFSGAQISFSLEKRVGPATSIGLSGLRTSVLSAFNPEEGNSFAVSSGVEVRWAQRLGPRLSWGAGADFQRLSFPVPLSEQSSFGGSSLARFAGVRRSDSIVGGRIEGRLQLIDLTAIQLGYVFHRRGSSVSPFSFERSRFIIGFSFGRTIPTRIGTRRF